MKLYLDEHLSDSLAQALNRHGLEAETTAVAGNLGLADELQLEYAVSQEAHLVSYNVGDFVRLANRMYAAGRSFPSILLLARSIPQDDFGKQERALTDLVGSPTFKKNQFGCILWAV